MIIYTIYLCYVVNSKCYKLLFLSMKMKPKYKDHEPRGRWEHWRGWALRDQRLLSDIWKLWVTSRRSNYYQQEVQGSVQKCCLMGKRGRGHLRKAWGSAMLAHEPMKRTWTFPLSELLANVTFLWSLEWFLTIETFPYSFLPIEKSVLYWSNKNAKT